MLDFRFWLAEKDRIGVQVTNRVEVEREREARVRFLSGRRVVEVKDILVI
jgi:hypothetical protein